MDIAETRKQLVILQELIDPLVHSTHGDTEEDFQRFTNEFFEDRDDTVDDAKRLARMLASLIASLSRYEVSQCTYYHMIEQEYKDELAELN